MPRFATALLLVLAGALAAEDAAERFETLIAAMDPAAEGQRLDLARELAAGGDPPRSAIRALEKVRRDAARTVGAVLSERAAAGIAQRLVQTLAPRREQVLKLIMDEGRYPDSKSKPAKGQDEVDRLVGELRAAWTDPLALAASELPEVAQRLTEAGPAFDRLRELDALLAVLDPETEPAAPAGDDLRAALNTLVRRALETPEWRAIREANAAAAYLAPEEQDHLVVLNDYRIMLGLAPLESDVRLWRAARGHSRDMAERGFFSHDSPLPGKKEPYDRAKLEGYQRASGENIHRGRTTGAEAFDSWYHSPGHHRNMVREKQRQIGVGHYQSNWTQLFGVDGPYASGAKRKPPRLALEEEIASLPADCPVERRVDLAQRAAAAELLTVAEAQLALAAEQAPQDERIAAALQRVREALAAEKR